MHHAPTARLFVVFVLFAPLGIRGEDLYVSPTGTPSGPGTITQTYDLPTALSGAVGKPGDTFWLSGGNYQIGHIDTKIQGGPERPITFRQRSGERARVDGSLTFYASAGYVVLRDFELYSSDTNRLSAQTGAGFDPTDIKILPGIASYAPNMSFINLIIHDETRHGLYLSKESYGNLIYGCVVYNNGWASPDNAEGHGIYVQGENGMREVSQNIVFNNSGANMHIYENAAGRYLAGVRLSGNVAFNAGAIQNVRAYRDWIVGVDAPASTADRIILENNMGFFAPTSGQDGRVQIGRDGINGSVALLDNYFPQGLVMNNWTIAAVAGNLLGAQPASVVLAVNQQPHLAAAWNNNTYAVPGGGQVGILANSAFVAFSEWQSATGFDSNSTYRVEDLSGTRVFVKPDWYEPGRANIIVYNWDDLDSVPVDVSSVLAPGAPYEVRNAEDFFAPPVLSGIYDGNLLDLPMTGLTVAAPNGPMLTPRPTGPTFNVFVLLPQTILLHATMDNGKAQVSWTTNATSWVLQFAPSLSADSAWEDVTNNRVVVGGQYEVTVPLSGKSGFYRLRAAP